MWEFNWIKYPKKNTFQEQTKQIHQQHLPAELPHKNNFQYVTEMDLGANQHLQHMVLLFWSAPDQMQEEDCTQHPKVLHLVCLSMSTFNMPDHFHTVSKCHCPLGPCVSPPQHRGIYNCWMQIASKLVERGV